MARVRRFGRTVPYDMMVNGLVVSRYDLRMILDDDEPLLIIILTYQPTKHENPIVALLLDSMLRDSTEEVLAAGMISCTIVYFKGTSTKRIFITQ